MTLNSNGEVSAVDIQLRPPPTGTQPVATAFQGSPLEDHLEDIERDAILSALKTSRHNKTAAAKALGMSFRALRYRIKKLGIE